MTVTEHHHQHRSIARNVVANWIGLSVFVLVGFITPRLISDWAGTEALGVWDVGWSLVSFSALLALGVSGAVTRYVARYRSVGDGAALNAMVNSALALLCGSFLLALLLAGGFAAVVPRLLSTASEQSIVAGQGVAWILGVSAAVTLPRSLFEGVISGCERFDLKNAIRISVSLALLGGMVLLLLGGYSVVALAWLVLGSEAVTLTVSCAVAMRVCPEFRINPALIRWPAAREALVFGGKTMLRMLGRSGLYATNRIIVVYYLGPVALAVYARQRALVMVAERFLTQYAHVLIPASSALHSSGRREGLEALLFRSTTYGLYISLPIVAVLAFEGGSLVGVWMGSGYEQPLVLAILALGHLSSLSQTSTLSILMGMHKHGLASFAELLTAVLSVGLGFLFVGALGWGMTGAALAVAIPVTVGGGLLVPFLACRALDVRPSCYLRKVLPKPLTVVLPFVLWLFVSQWCIPGGDFVSLVIRLGVGTGILIVLYWYFVLPSSLKTKIIGFVSPARFGRRRSPPGSSGLVEDEDSRRQDTSSM